MSPSYNGWADEPEDEREELGLFEEFDGWPEPDPMLACEYWLLKGMMDKEAGQ